MQDLEELKARREQLKQMKAIREANKNLQNAKIANEKVRIPTLTNAPQAELNAYNTLKNATSKTSYVPPTNTPQQTATPQTVSDIKLNTRAGDSVISANEVKDMLARNEEYPHTLRGKLRTIGDVGVSSAAEGFNKIGKAANVLSDIASEKFKRDGLSLNDLRFKHTEEEQRGINTTKDLIDMINNTSIEPTRFQQYIQNQNERAYSDLSKQDALTQFVGRGLGTVTAMAPTIAFNAVAPGTGTTAMFLTSGQSAFEKAKSEGATNTQALSNAILSGTLETTTEKIGGEGIAKLTGMPTLLNKLGITSSNKLVSLLTDVASEGLEELVSTGVQPIIDRITYNPNAPLATVQDYWSSFTESILPTLIFSGINASVEGINNYKQKAIEKVNNSNITQEQKASAVGQINQGANELTSIVKQSLGDRETTQSNQQVEIPTHIKTFVENRNKTAPGLSVEMDNTISTDGIIIKNSDGTRTIKINPNSSRAYEFVAVHEMLHDLDGTQDYKDLSDFVQNRAKTTNGYEEAKAQITKEYEDFYKRNNLDLSKLDMDVETVNDMTAQALGNQEFLNELAAENPNLFQKIYNWFKNVLFDGNNTGKTFNERRYLNQLKSKFENAYNAVYNGDEGKNFDIKTLQSSFSLTENTPATDNKGRELTTEKQEYFKDSKVRDEKGNLKVMYHGTDEDFNTFSYEFYGKTGTAYGRGFYFIDNKNAAESYGSNVKEVYLDIKKPMQIGEKTMSKNDFRNLILAVNKETNGTLLEDYGGIDEAVMEYEYGGDDIDLTNSIMIASGLNFEKFYRILKSTLGYDGIKANNITNGKDGNIYLAFTPEQIKNVDNANPTSNPDIRYSKPTTEWSKYLKENWDLMPNSTKTMAKEVEKLNPKREVTENNRDLSDNLTEQMKKEVDILNLKSNNNETEQVKQEGGQQTAELLSQRPEGAKKTIKQHIDDAMTQLVNKGHAVDQLAKKANNPQLTYKYDRMLSAANEGNYVIGQKQTNNEGKIIGKSINEIWKPVEDAGKVEDFSLYLLHKLNIERMSLETPNGVQNAINQYNEFILEHPEFENMPQWQLKEMAKGEDTVSELTQEYFDLMSEIEKQKNIKNKPVFGDTVTADVSKDEVARMEKENPVFKEWSQDINKFNKNQLQNMVDAGLTSEETQELLNDMYDNYIRIQREVSGNSPIINNKGNLKVNSPIKKATGGNQNILPLKDSMAQQAIEVKKAISRNLFGQELLKTLKNGEKVTEYGEILTKGKKGEAPTFTVFENGNPIRMKINDELYEALKPAERSILDEFFLVKGLQGAVKYQKAVLTNKNPIFAFTNAVRDFQTAIVNSKNTGKMLKNYAKLAKLEFDKMYHKDTKTSLSKNDQTMLDLWELYKANGGEGNTYFDFETGVKKPTKNIAKKLIDRVGTLNEIIEQMPRVAEFITTLENGGNIDEAMYNAADVTTNFKRGGELAKKLDRNGASFLNASIQGFDKQIRNITGANGAKGYISLVLKTAMIGILPSVLNHLLLHDDDDYKDLPDYIKDNYWLFKVGEHKFIRIPKGRDIPTFLGVVEQRTLRAIEGEKDAFKGIIDTFLNSLAPNNPFTDNIFAPLFAVENNKSWNGSQIVSSSLENKIPKQQYDAKTTEFSKWLGDKISYSPKKIDYLLDQYTGGIGDVLMPLNTKYAEEGGPLTSKFMTDSINNNKNVSKFYDLKNELTINKNSDVIDERGLYELKYLNDVNDKISELNKQKREVESSDLKNKEKKKQANKIQSQINTKTKEAVNTYEKYGEVAEKNLNNKNVTKTALRGSEPDITEENKNEKIQKTVKAYTDKEIFGAEYALAEYNKDVSEKQKKADIEGISSDVFFKAYFAQKGVKGYKDSKGNTIDLSEPRNKKKAIDEATKDLTELERMKLYRIFDISQKVW